jgi:hypothetical protein
VAGRAQAFDPKLSDLDRVAVPEGLGAGHLLSWIGDDREPKAPLQLLVVRDVIAVGMRRQEVGHLDVQPVDRGEQRLQRRAAVHEDGVAAGPVGDEVGVREPVRVHAPFNDHARGRMPAHRTR